MSWREHGFSKVIEQIASGVAITGLDGTLDYAAACLLKLIGARGEELVGASLSRFVRPAVAGPHGEPRDFSGAAQNPRREVRICGSEETLDALESAYPIHDTAGAVTHFIHLLRDISAQRNHGAFALLYIDVDHFKRINDTPGHDAGDELLRQLSARLAQSLRAAHTVARWGGDEFVALLDGVGNPQAAARIARKSISTCGGPYRVRGCTRRVTLSIGASLYLELGTWNTQDAPSSRNTIGTSTQDSTGSAPCRAGRKRQVFTVSSAALSSCNEPLLFSTSTRAGRPSRVTSTLKVTVPCSPARRAARG